MIANVFVLLIYGKTRTNKPLLKIKLQNHNPNSKFNCNFIYDSFCF